MSTRKISCAPTTNLLMIATATSFIVRLYIHQHNDTIQSTNSMYSYESNYYQTCIRGKKYWYMDIDKVVLRQLGQYTNDR